MSLAKNMQCNRYKSREPKIGFIAASTSRSRSRPLAHLMSIGWWRFQFVIQTFPCVMSFFFKNYSHASGVRESRWDKAMLSSLIYRAIFLPHDHKQRGDCQTGCLAGIVFASKKLGRCINSIRIRGEVHIQPFFYVFATLIFQTLRWTCFRKSIKVELHWGTFR